MHLANCKYLHCHDGKVKALICNLLFKLNPRAYRRNQKGKAKKSQFFFHFLTPIKKLNCYDMLFQYNLHISALFMH